MDLQEIRQRVPQLQGLDDEAALNVIHRVYYPGADRAVLAEKLGVKPAQSETAPKRTVLGTLGDAGLSLVKGAIAVPEAAVGLADIVTGGRVGKALEEVGYRPAEARQMLDGGYSDAQQAANQRFRDAEGFTGKLAAAIENPSVIGHTVLESAPSMGAGAAAARGLLTVAPRVGAVVAGASGEGLVGAGSAAEQIRQQTEDGLLTAGQARDAAASGAITGALSILGGKVAQRLGIGDVDTMLAAGARDAGLRKNIVRRVIEGAAAEGLLEELPQSVQEQMLHNHALGRPLDEGVDEAAVLGLLSGAAMGGGAAGLARPATGRQPAQAAPAAAPLPAAAPAAPPAAPADPRAQAIEAFRGLSTKYGLSAEAVKAAERAAQGKPPEEVPGFLARYASALDRRGMFGKPLDPADLGVFGSSPAASGTPPGTSVPPVRQELPPLPEEGGARVVEDEPFSDRILTLQEQLYDEPTRQKVRERFGADGLDTALYYLGAANRPEVPAKTRERMLTLAERILGGSVLTPVAQQQRLGSDEFGPAASIGMDASPQRIGMDTTPTGTIRVGPDGVAAPEVAADLISDRQRAQEREALGQGVPRGGAPEAPALAYDSSPTGRMLGGHDGVRAETNADRINIQQQQARIEVEAARKADLGMTPDVERAQAQRAQGLQFVPGPAPVASVLRANASAAPMLATPGDAAAHEAATSPTNDRPEPSEAQKN